MSIKCRAFQFFLVSFTCANNFSVRGWPEKMTVYVSLGAFYIYGEHLRVCVSMKLFTIYIVHKYTKVTEYFKQEIFKSNHEPTPNMP